MPLQFTDKTQDSRKKETPVSKEELRVVTDTAERAYSDLDKERLGSGLTLDELNRAAGDIELPKPVRAIASALARNFGSVQELSKDPSKGISPDDLDILEIPGKGKAGGKLLLPSPTARPTEARERVVSDFRDKMKEFQAESWLQERAQTLNTLQAAAEGTNFDVSFTRPIPLQLTDETFARFSLTTNEGFYADLTREQLKAANNWVNTGTPQMKVEVSAEGKIIEVSMTADHFRDPGSKTHEVAESYNKEQPVVTKEVLKKLEAEMSIAMKKDISR